MRLLLLPFSWIYGWIVWIRNRMFDLHWLKQESFEVPVITVGNLSAGGTGKSPLVLHLAEQLCTEYKVAILSRGYGRTTSGYRLLDDSSTATTVGDEPMQYFRLLKGVHVAVCEKRAEGIRRLLQMDPSVQLILLDDAFQHRYVKPALSILLTDYSFPYDQDHLLPAGRLREPVAGAARASMVVVTKCPSDITPQKKQELEQRLKRSPAQQFFFSYIRYRDLALRGQEVTLPLSSLKGKKILLVCGIARPEPLLGFLQSQGAVTTELFFPDHHAFSAGDALQMVKKFGQSGAEWLVTTRKDAMRMEAAELQQHLSRLPVYILDISPAFIGEDPASAVRALLRR